MSTKKEVKKLEREKNLQDVMHWVREQLRRGDVPRFVDAIEYAKKVRKFHHLSKKMITEALRLETAYLMNSKQQREKLRSKKNRPILVNSLGNLHSDLAFFSARKNVSTPKSFQKGVLFCKDVLSRMLYFVILSKDRKAPEIIKAFKKINHQFQTHSGGHHIQSISFDQERSVMSKEVQDFFQSQSWKFVFFTNSSSKSKVAENAISLVRKDIARLAASGKEKRWWHLITLAVNSLNHKPIQINGQFLKRANGTYFRPIDVNTKNLDEFITQLHKVSPAYNWAQYDVGSRWGNFKFEIGTYVRPKLIVTSSEVLGTKRSEVTLKEEPFKIKDRFVYVTARNTLGNAYVCKSKSKGRIEVFEEDDIAETVISDFES